MGVKTKAKGQAHKRRQPPLAQDPLQRVRAKGRARKPQHGWRLLLVGAAGIALLTAIAWKIVDLQVINNEILQGHGDDRTVRNEALVATRGNIIDRRGQPLAISTPVLSLWLNPKEILPNPQAWPTLTEPLQALGVDVAALAQRVKASAQREFLYIKRRLPPAEAQSVLELGVPGVYAQEEYKRYYPLGEVAAHIVGLTNSEDVGQEGLELAYEDWLRGKPGERQVLKDRLGRVIQEVKLNAVAAPGQDLQLSIDSRIQYLAYKALKEEVTRRRAQAGTAVVLDAVSGEVLAMVNQPSYNPNNRASLSHEGLRNRAMVDLLEPGSTVKSFTITAALESGLFDTSSVIDTSPGYIRVDQAVIRDPVNYGESDLERILSKSSQIGAVKLGLAMGEAPMLEVLGRLGFGRVIGSGFPGEAAGALPSHRRWSKAEIATLAYGYGFQVTPLQLAQAYMIYANRGIKKPISLLKVEEPASGERVLGAELSETLTAMLETVVAPGQGGTGTRAWIPSHRVAGKTGTAWHYDVAKGGYDSENYISLFAGFAPVGKPRIVAVVTIHEPKGEEYGGGHVAAPVFARIAAGALRLLHVPPDQVEQSSTQLSLNLPSSQAIPWSNL